MGYTSDCKITMAVSAYSIPRDDISRACSAALAFPRLAFDCVFFEADNIIHDLFVCLEIRIYHVYY